MEEKKIEEMLEGFGKMFWESVNGELNKIDKRDGTTITREQKGFRALVLLHLRVKKLERELQELKHKQT